MNVERQDVFRSNPILRDRGDALALSEKFQIPEYDVILTALNLSGVASDLSEKRIRFHLTPGGTQKDFYFALCVNTISYTPFKLKDGSIYLAGESIGSVSLVENDTCNDSYFRRNGTELTLNTNSRSSCTGCAICGTYSQEADDKDRLMKKKILSRRVNEIMFENGQKDFSNLHRVTVCTGCFGSEKTIVNHLLDLNNVLQNNGFNGILRYIGSEITSENALDTLARNVGHFSLSFSTEMFTRRNLLLRKIKSRVSFDDTKRILKGCLDRGVEANILYVLGFDSLSSFEDGFRQLKPIMNHFPVINLFQVYSPEQVLLRNDEANNIEYYLKARKIIEDLYKTSSLRPESWENYRPLWYLSFGEEEKNDIRI